MGLTLIKVNFGWVPVDFKVDSSAFIILTLNKLAFAIDSEDVKVVF